MKLVKFQCTVNTLRAKEATEVTDVKTHTIWINPNDIQMVAPQIADSTDVYIVFRGTGGSTSVEGTFEEVVAALTSE